MSLAWVIPSWGVAVAVAVLYVASVWLVATLFTKRRTRQYRSNIAQLQDECVRLSAAWADADRRFREQFERIDGYLRERDTWTALYHEEAAAHGNAQTMMLAERQRLIHQLRAAGQKPKVDSTIDQVAKSFSDTHVEAARQGCMPSEVIKKSEKEAEDSEP
jgi:hypothetical protein